jgi:hypothetical protein
MPVTKQVNKPLREPQLTDFPAAAAAAPGLTLMAEIWLGV